MKTDLLALAAAAAVALCALPVSADTPPPFPEFSAKRVAPPGAGAKRFITVQIDPTVAVRPAPAAPDDTHAAPIGRYGWFWEEVDPDIGIEGPLRVSAALGALDKVAGGARDIAAPRVQDLRNLAEAYGIDILTASLETRVSPALALAVMAVESSGRADAVSSAGARGLMQLMPATAERFGVNDTTARENIRGGIEYLDWLIRHFEDDVVLALAGYNAGEGAVAEHAGVPPYAETRDYVPKVLAAWRVARLLCMTPPQFVSDGCVFQGQMARAN